MIYLLEKGEAKSNKKSYVLNGKWQVLICLSSSLKRIHSLRALWTVCLSLCCFLLLASHELIHSSDPSRSNPGTAGELIYCITVKTLHLQIGCSIAGITANCPSHSSAQPSFDIAVLACLTSTLNFQTMPCVHPTVDASEGPSITLFAAQDCQVENHAR